MRNLPALVFAMRYPDAIGLVHNSMARIYDRVAELLRDDFSCLIAYPQLTASPEFVPRHLTRLEADFYDTTACNRTQLRSIAQEHQVSVVVYMGAAARNRRLLHRLGILTMDYVQYSFPSNLEQSWTKSLLKEIVRRRLRWNLDDVYIANAHHQRNFLLRYAHLPEERVITITNGVDVNHFCPGPAPTILDPEVPVTTYYATSICQARPEKRVDILIEAAAQVFLKRPELPITFLHVGGGQELEHWRDKAKSLGLAGRFLFLGHRNDVLPYLRSCSFYLHSAERESFGFAIAEAMACGKPVICADALGPRELVEHGITGLLIQQGKVDAFADAILAMLDDPATIQRMGHAARERAVTWFSLERQANEFATLVRQRFGGQRRSTGICRTASV